MGDDANRFRARAKECRGRAQNADYVMRAYLLEIARELEEEADKIEAEGTARGTE